jgi:hypothetical protein
MGREDDGGLYIEGGFIKTCDSMKYLGSVVTNGGTCDACIQNKNSTEKMPTNVFHGMLWTKNISKEIKKIYIDIYNSRAKPR